MIMTEVFASNLYNNIIDKQSYDSWIKLDIGLVSEILRWLGKSTDLIARLNELNWANLVQQIKNKSWNKIFEATGSFLSTKKNNGL